MSVNGIGQGYYGNYYGTSRISSLHNTQLQQAMQKISRSSAVSNSNVTRYMDKSSSDFLKTYNSSMSSLMTSASKLRTANNSVWNSTKISASDEAVMDVEQKYRMSSNDTYEVNVKQLAAGQVNSTNSVAAGETAKADVAITISSAKHVPTVFEVKAQDDAGNFKTNEQMYKEMADAINESGMGVKAEVSTKDGNVQLTLTSEKTGEANAFKVEGSFAEETGLNKVSTEAQDAKYTVSKNGRQAQEYTAEENTVSMDFGRMSATLKKEGKTTLEVGVDNDKVISAVKDVVESYNSAITMLQDNFDRGYGVERQLGNMLRMGVSERSLEKVGIKQDAEGQLHLDEAKLTESLKKNPGLTKELLGGSFSLAQSVFEDGRQGLNQSGASLIQNDLDQAMENNLSDPFNLMGLYSRSGAYTMTNFYAIGNFVNMLL